MLSGIDKNARHTSESSSLLSYSALLRLIGLIFFTSSLIAVGMALSHIAPSYQQLQTGEGAFIQPHFFPSNLIASQLTSPSPLTNMPETKNNDNNSNSNLSTYQNSSFFGISIQYSSDWLLQERTNTSSIKFSSPAKADLMVVSVYVQNLSSFPAQQQNMTLDSLTRMSVNAAKENLNNFQLLDLETANVTLGLGQNDQAHKIIYLNTNKNASLPLQFVTMQTYTIKDGKIYGISYVSEASQFFRHLPAVQRMIDSFHIID